MTVKSWNLHVFQSKYLRQLSILPYFLIKPFIQSTLRQNQVPQSNQLINMLMQQTFSMQFLNSFIVRKKLLNYRSVNQLRTDLIILVNQQKRNLFTNQKLYQIEQETLNFSFPILSYILFLLVYTLTAYSLNINLLPSNQTVLEVLSVVPVTVSVIYFVWQHRNQVFIKQKEGTIILRQTNRFDLLKLSLLGLMMAGIEILLSFIGYLWGKRIDLSTSSSVLMSLGFWLIGFILAYLVHFIWNYFPGVLGKIYKINTKITLNNYLI